MGVGVWCVGMVCVRGGCCVGMCLWVGGWVGVGVVGVGVGVVGVWGVLSGWVWM